MNKKKIYLAGKVTGLSMVVASQKFGIIERALMMEGYEVVNPLNLIGRDVTTWKKAMRICIKALVDCDEAYFMPCWVDSPGALLERIIVDNLQIPLHPNSK